MLTRPVGHSAVDELLFDEFLFPERITRLHLAKLGSDFDLKSFTNLEYLTFRNFPGMEHDELTLDLPTLKLLSIRPDYRKELEFYLL